MKAYYGDNDPFCCQWLRNLIKAGLIADGDVDERSIADVKAKELQGYNQIHLFAGIGGWSLACRLIGWPDAAPIFTGSCPCQPYSCAGSNKGDEDPRNLWPQMYRLARELRPVVIAGEQVENAIGHGWLDGISADLEAENYAVWPAVLGAHSAGAPHIRQRLYWLGNAACTEWRPPTKSGQDERDGNDSGRQKETGGHKLASDKFSGMADFTSLPSSEHGQESRQEMGRKAGPHDASNGGGLNVWAPYFTVYCRDNVYRRYGAEPGAFPLAPRLPRSVGPGSTRSKRMGLLAAKANRACRLRGYGNSIVPEVAGWFLRAFMLCQV